MLKKANQQGILALTILTIMALVGISFAGFNNRLADCPNGPMKADLTGGDINGKTPSGSVQFNDKKTNDLKVKVKSVNVPKDTALAVFVGDTNVGQIAVSGTGSGELKLDSATVTEGSIISVKNGEVILLTGSFACVANKNSKSPSPNATATTSPTEVPTTVPTATPTEAPTVEPTVVPTVEPTVEPTVSPTDVPTKTPTATPTPTPTETPTIAPPMQPR